MEVCQDPHKVTQQRALSVMPESTEVYVPAAGSHIEANNNSHAGLNQIGHRT